MNLKNQIIISKNHYGNLVYGTTGLILKALIDENGKIRNRVVAREGLSGEWLELNQRDKELCMKLKLKYEKIDFKIPKINTLKYTKEIPLINIKEEELKKYEEDEEYFD
jgi:hypothetical protein